MRLYLRHTFPIYVCLLSLALIVVSEHHSFARDWHVAIEHPNANDHHRGNEHQPLRTITAATRQVQPGDRILIHDGIYREQIALTVGGTMAKPITFAAATGQSPVIRGSDLWDQPWRTVPNMPFVFQTDLKSLPAKDNPFLQKIYIGGKNPYHLSRPTAPLQAHLPLSIGQVFCNGEILRQVDAYNLLKSFSGTWLVDPTGQSLLVHPPDRITDPNKAMMELSTRTSIFRPTRRGLGYIHLNGLVFEHCANQGSFPQAGAVSTRAGHHWLIENCTIANANTIGLDCGWETWDQSNLINTLDEDRIRFNVTGHVIQNNIIRDNGLCGIAGINTKQVTISNNQILRNNTQDFSAPWAKWEEWGGIKLHGCDDALIQNNLVMDNEGYGIWLDNGYANAKVLYNTVLNNRMAGIFLELGNGPAQIASNIVAYTRPRGSYYNGMGIYTHDASGVQVLHNLVLGNAGFGVMMRSTSDRKFAGHLVQTNNQIIQGNIIFENSLPAISLPWPNDRAGNNHSDYNLLWAAHEYWQGQRAWPSLFAINRFKNTVNTEQMVAQVLQRLQKDGHMNIPFLDEKNWPRNPVLSLIHWRSAMQQDQHSVESPNMLKIWLRPRQRTLTFDVDESFFKRICPPIDELNVDFNRQPVSASTWLFGPFQHLKPGINHLFLQPAVTTKTEP